MPVDANWADVHLLLHGDGKKGSQTVKDSSSFAHPITVAGNAQHDRSRTDAYGGSCLLFDGAGDYLISDTSANFNPSLGDWTLEARVRINSLSAQNYILQLWASTTSKISIRHDTAGRLILFFQNGGTSFGLTPNTAYPPMSLGQWYHVFMEREGGNIRFGWDGMDVYNTAAGTFPNASMRVEVGANVANASNYFNGRIEEVRFTKGLARYTGTSAAFTPGSFFTPPTEAFYDEVAISSASVTGFHGTGVGAVDATEMDPADTAVFTGFKNTAFGSAHAEEIDIGAVSGFHNTAFGDGHVGSANAQGFRRTNFGNVAAVEIVAVALELEIAERHDIGVELELLQDIGGAIGLELAVSHSIGPPYTPVTLELAMPVLGLIGLELAAVNHLWARPSLELDLPYSLTEQIGMELSFGQVIRDQNLIGVEFAAPFTYLTGGVIDSYATAYVQGSDFTVELEEVELASDEGSPVWECTAKLKNVGDIQRFKVNDSFSVVLEGESYSFIVDSRAVDRNDPSAPQAVLYGISPLAQFQSPRADKLSKTWAADIAATDIAQELMPGLVWNIVDWVVPGGLFGVNDASPYQALLRLVEAAGGLIESLPDGTMQARYKHLVSVPQYSDATATHTLSDMEDNFTSSERYSPNVMVNLLTIGDQQAESSNDRTEFIADEVARDTGIVRVYPQVWRSNVRARATGNLSITPLGVKSRSEEEVVEFTAGRANLRFPADSITSVQWLTANLGSVTAKPYSNALIASGGDGYSMAKISYITKAHEFRAIGQLDIDPVQVVIED